MNMGINEYLELVGSKLASPSATQLLQFGTRAKVRGQSMLRDDEGMLSTKSNVLDIAQNFFSATKGRDELQSVFANFSTVNSPSTGEEAVSAVKTVGAIDVTILSLATSIIPFIAMDRAMATPTATIYYNDLVALNSNGEVAAGDIVSGNFQPPNMKVNLSTEKSGVELTGTQGSYKKNLGKVVPGSVIVKFRFTKNGAEDYIVEGRDYAQNGSIMFPANSGVTSAEIDYDGEAVTTGGSSFEMTAATPAGAPDGYTLAAEKPVTIDYQVDVPAENGADNGALVVAPQYTPVTLDTTRDNIIVQDNLVNRMAMNKVQMIATAGAGGTSQADVLMARTKNTYIEALNRKVLVATLSGYNGTNILTSSTVTLDLSNYNVGAWATTKNDQVLQLMTNLEAKFLATTGIACTAIITSSYGVALLQCIPNMWTSNPDAVNGLNGLAGYFNGKAVYRHNYINGMTFKKDAANVLAIPFFAVAKLPDNNSGSSVFGEYLPLTSTGVVGNFNNPQNISTGFFSQTGVKVVDGKLIEMATIVPPTGGLFQ